MRGADGRHVLPAVADPAVILAPSHLGCAGQEVRAGDVVMEADFRATDAGEE
jgi:hypothetical protein